MSVTTELRERDLALERTLTLLAARAAGLTGDGGLGAYADYRAWPGGIRLDLDPVRETREELADARNYIVWGIERIYARVLAGDPDVLDDYVRLLASLTHITRAWAALS